MKSLLISLIAILTGVAPLCGETSQPAPESLFREALRMERGNESAPPDSLRASVLLDMAARRGYAPAQNYLGYRYFNGRGIRQDVDSALYWLAKAAGQGDAKAANNLGYLLGWSDRVARDYPQAVKWLRRAADAGLPTGQSQLADLMRGGLGTPPDTIGAATLYEKAIAAGLRDAELKLTSMMGYRWERLPADSALRLGRHYLRLGAPYAASVLLKNAASQGEPDAMALMGHLYSRGEGVEYDYRRSVIYYYEAARRGVAPAQFVIGELLDIFPDALEGIAPDYPDTPGAHYWYDEAARNGIMDAEAATRNLLQSP